MDTSADQTSPNCTASAMQWATLMITIISINVTWWLLEIPLIWKHGFKRYLNSVTWQCFRMYMPSCAAIYALVSAQSPEEEPYIFYVGPFDDYTTSSQTPNIEIASPPTTEIQPELPESEPPARNLSKFKLIKSLAVDGMTIVSTGLTINNAVNAPVGTSVSGINSLTWAYPTLPVALIGLWLLVCGIWIRWSRKWTFWLGMLLVIGVGAAIIAPVAVLSPAGRQNMAWIPALIGYALMGLPFLAFPHGVVVLGGVAVGFISRVGGIGIGSLSPRADFPFCQLRHPAFGAIYLTVGGIGAFLAAVGWFKFLWKMDPTRNPRNKDVKLLKGYTLVRTNAHVPATRAGRRRWTASRRG